MTKCAIPKIQRVKSLLAKELIDLHNRISDLHSSIQLNKVLVDFSQHIVRICEEGRVPKTFEIEQSWERYLKNPVFSLIAHVKLGSIGMSIFEYGNKVWKRAIEIWAERCECSSILIPSFEQRLQARRECLRKCQN